MGVNSYDGDDVIVKGIRGGDSKEISSVDDNGTERLAVDASVSIDNTIDPSEVVVAVAYPDINLPTVSNPHAVIYSFTGAGALYGFSFEFSDKNCYARLVIDGSEVFDVNCRILCDLYGGTNTSIRSWVTYDLNNDVFHFAPANPFKFATSISLEAKATNNNTGRYLARYKAEHTDV